MTEPTPQRAPWWVLVVVIVVVGIVVAWIKLPPWWFLVREDLASCGQVARHDLAPEQTTCLEQGGELEVLEFSDEGDAGSTWIRVLDDGDVEALAQSRDPYGKQGWSRRTCPDLASCLEP